MRGRYILPSLAALALITAKVVGCSFGPEEYKGPFPLAGDDSGSDGASAEGSGDDGAMTGDGTGDDSSMTGDGTGDDSSMTGDGPGDDSSMTDGPGDDSSTTEGGTDGGRDGGRPRDAGRG
jgi:hypothetical protein